jgi:Ca2+-transporting ATPase
MHFKELKELFKEFDTSTDGLTDAQAKKSLEKYGPNEIKEKKRLSPIKIFLNQFNNFLIYILFAALALSIILGDEKVESLAIGVVLLIIGLAGFIQEYKAEKAIEALKKMASLQAKVVRNGEEKRIDATELLPGDMILLEAGDKVPADARLIEVSELNTQESALTGESVPVKKEKAVLKEKTPVADRVNMVFSGTIVTAGKAKALVTATGMKTELGKIAELIQTAKTAPTPLQIKLEKLGKFIGIAVIAIAVIIYLIGIFSGKNILEMLVVAIALAVAAVPEGLPAVVTISLALGVQRMIKRNALVRKLPSVETLGSTTVICTDKTGTLTCNEMTVRKLYVDDEIFEVTGEGYSTQGSFQKGKTKVNPKRFSKLLQIGALCNDAKVAGQNLGDPTEIALIISARKAGLKDNYQRFGEIQFTSERKMMSTFHNINRKKNIYTKGAVDVILKKCSKILSNGKVKPLTANDKKNISRVNERFAKEALRVLGFAYKEGELTEKNLIFVGMQAMIDPPRSEVKDAIIRAKKAGIRVVMITGDYIGTAKAIANELGIQGKALEGKDLNRINLHKEIDKIAIYARVNPEDKTRIVDALRKKGHIIAMTGDGVNDAPALKKADIGIAMGITGTDVSKEASDMILVDDNFASIVNAVEEGRSIYDNIRKFVNYLLSSNLGEVLTIFLAMLLAPFFLNVLPLLPLQLLWINFATDVFPALALSVDPSQPDIMEKKPRSPKENILTRGMLQRMLIIGLIMMVGTLFVFKWYLGKNISYAQTMAFSTLMMFQMWNVLNCRSTDKSLFSIGPFSNKWLIGAIILSILLQLVVIYTPFSIIFKTAQLTFLDWAYVILISSSVFIIVEIIKLIKK